MPSLKAICSVNQCHKKQQNNDSSTHNTTTNKSASPWFDSDWTGIPDVTLLVWNNTAVCMPSNQGILVLPMTVLCDWINHIPSLEEMTPKHSDDYQKYTLVRFCDVLSVIWSDVFCIDFTTIGVLVLPLTRSSFRIRNRWLLPSISISYSYFPSLFVLSIFHDIMFTLLNEWFDFTNFCMHYDLQVWIPWSKKKVQNAPINCLKVEMDGYVTSNSCNIQQLICVSFFSFFIKKKSTTEWLTISLSLSLSLSSHTIAFIFLRYFTESNRRKRHGYAGNQYNQRQYIAIIITRWRRLLPAPMFPEDQNEIRNHALLRASLNMALKMQRWISR